MSTDSEWEAAVEAIGNFAVEFSQENEQLARLAAAGSKDSNRAGARFKTNKP